MNSVKVRVGCIVVRVRVWIRLYKRMKIKISQYPHKVLTKKEGRMCVWSPGRMPSPLLSWLLPQAESTNVV